MYVKQRNLNLFGHNCGLDNRRLIKTGMPCVAINGNRVTLDGCGPLWLIGAVMPHPLPYPD